MAQMEWRKALQWLCTYDHTSSAAEAAALQKYFTAHPQQLNVADGDGWLPLHYAAANQYGEHAVAIVAFLLKAHRNGAMQREYIGECLPLHWATFNQKGDFGAAIVSLLLKAYPEGAMQKDYSGYTPADDAARKAQLPASCIAMLRGSAEGKWTQIPSSIAAVVAQGPPPASSSRQHAPAVDKAIPFAALSPFLTAEHLLDDSGAFGPVYSGQWKGHDVAIKVVRGVGSPSAELRNQFDREIQMLYELQHPHLLPLMGGSFDNRLAIVYELRGSGPLSSMLVAARQSAALLPWRRRVGIMVELYSALSYLHNDVNPPLVHRDVKSANVLLDHNLSACLGDFGVARVFQSNAGAAHASTQIFGTPGYIDPAYATTGRVTLKADVYSAGVVVAELLTSMPAILPEQADDDVSSLAGQFLEWRDDDAPFATFADAAVEWPEAVLADVVPLVERMLAARPKKRPTSAELLASLQGVVESHAPIADGAAEAAAAQAETLCCICSDGLPVHAIVPCGHVCLCLDPACVDPYRAKQQEQCPLCRTTIEGVLRVYF